MAHRPSGLARGADNDRLRGSRPRSVLLHELRILITSYPDVLMATVAFGLLVMAGVSSFRAVRSRVRYETWWVVHLYTYLAIALAFAHQLANGVSFVGHPLARVFWAVIWASTAGVVLVYRVLLPLWRTLYHRLRVVEVRHEGPGVVSVICSGHHIDRLRVAGGQFLQWRFLRRGMWWQAHPYSISALPRAPYLRVTVKTLGDFSKSVAELPVGTRVAIEGPYGAVTDKARLGDKVLLVAAGVGVTPMRALLEDLPEGVDVVVVLRAPTEEDLHLPRRDGPARGGPSAVACTCWSAAATVCASTHGCSDDSSPTSTGATCTCAGPTASPTGS